MLKYKINRKSLVIIYNAWIRPILEYGDIVLDNCSIKDSKILEDLQVEAARIITGLGHNSSRSKLYDELGWDLLSTMRTIHKRILLYKIINGFAPQYLCDLLEPFHPRSHQYNLRNNNNFILTQIKTTSYMEFVFHLQLNFGMTFLIL